MNTNAAIAIVAIWAATALICLAELWINREKPVVLRMSIPWVVLWAAVATVFVAEFG